MGNDVCHCYLDTNTFLHYQLFTEVDWCEELKSSCVVLIVCSAVLSELDKKKFSDSDSRIRNRAKKVISKLSEIASQNEVRTNVQLLFLTNEPKIQWEHEGLDPGIIDDRIIGTILSEEGTKRGAVLMTADLGLRLKAQARGIQCHTLSEQMMLPTKTPEEEEIGKLRERLQRFEHRLPKLSLKLLSQGKIADFAEFSLKKLAPLTQADIEAEVAKIRNQQQKFVPPSRGVGAVLASLSAGFPQSEIDRYNKEIEEYAKQVRDYLKGKWVHRELLSRTLRLRFALVNNGSSPGEDIDIFLHFPDGFKLVDNEGLPKGPTAPQQPTPPRTMIEMFQDMGRLNIPYLPRISPSVINPHTRPDVPKGPLIKKTNSYEVSFSVQRLKHGLQTIFDPLFTVFPSIESVCSFGIDYRVLAANLPGEIKRDVHVILKVEDY
jgi:rRNA-processing protein FCF1